ncbi:MAG: hypothetical protein WC683_01690 [bacterium]
MAKTDKQSGISEIAEKASMLKRAGLPTVAVLLVAAMGVPGFWEFLDDTDDKAEAKADVAYQLLKARIESMCERMERMDAAETALRETVNAMLLQRASVSTGYMRMPMVAGAGQGGAVPPVVEVVPVTAAPMPARAASLPKDLDQLAARALQEEAE